MRWPSSVENKRLAVVQGVGYPNPDRSHFRSMEIWESARLENDAKALETGWLGRTLDAAGNGKPGHDPPGLHVGSRSLPLALRSKKTEVPSVESLESYKLQLAGTEAEKQAERGALNKLAAMERRERRPAAGLHQPDHAVGLRVEQPARAARQERAGGPKYPNYGLAKRLELIAQIIKADFGTRIFYTSLDGFDTHANQLGTHAALLARAFGFDRRVSRRPGRGRPGRPRRAADVQRVRPPGAGERVGRHRPRRGRAAVPRRAGRERRTCRCTSRASMIWTTAI